MKYTEARYGRVFVIRLEDGEILHEEIERFAHKKSVHAAFLIVLGGADEGSKLVVGPLKGRSATIVSMESVLSEPYEIVGTGTLFPNSKGKSILHMHVACGRKKRTQTGCVRKGVKVWHVMELILVELIGIHSKRILDKKTGFELLIP